MIEIFHSACKGRGLRAKNGISSGSSVLSSYPVAYVLSKSQKGIRCDHCLKRYRMCFWIWKGYIFFTCLL